MKGGKMPWEGEKIKALAKETNITLINLAKQIGVAHKGIGCLVQTVRKISPDDCARHIKEELGKAVCG